MPGTEGVQAAVIAIANGTSDEVAVWKNNTGAPVTVTKVGYTPDTAVTGNTTNNFTLQAKSKVPAGTAAANVSAVKIYGTGVDIAQFVEDTLVLSTTAADVRIEDGELVTLDKAETGSGLTMPAGIVTIEYQYVG